MFNQETSGTQVVEALTVLNSKGIEHLTIEQLQILNTVTKGHDRQIVNQLHLRELEEMDRKEAYNDYFSWSSRSRVCDGCNGKGCIVCEPHRFISGGSISFSSR